AYRAGGFRAAAPGRGLLTIAVIIATAKCREHRAQRAVTAPYCRPQLECRPSSRPALRDGSWRGQSDDRANPCCCSRSLSDRIPESWHHSARISAARWKASDDAATHVRTSIETTVSRMRSYPLDHQLSDRFASIDDA